jgi:hypothetical protein
MRRERGVCAATRIGFAMLVQRHVATLALSFLGHGSEPALYL